MTAKVLKSAVRHPERESEMPIFMDRHDIKGATAAEIADAHRKDLEIQDQYGVKFLTYWFDQHRGTTFCLIDAPDSHTAECVHRDAHGHIAGEVLEVPLSAVEAFLGRIQDPQPPSGQSGPQVDPGLRAIMFTDIVGSTEMTARLGDRLATELIRAHDSIVRRDLGRFNGREVKHTGDGIMASFPSTTDAVACAAAIQQGFAQYNRGNLEPLHIRIGLDCGEPVEDSNDLFGSTVQLAARLCAAADEDQILVSENIVREHGGSAVFVQTGSRPMKGFSEPVAAYECPWTAGA
jgi:class 3 adenylate cyclase